MPDNKRARTIRAYTEVEQLAEARRIVRQEADVLVRLADQLDENFCAALRLISAAGGCVVVTGVGKAGLIGQKVVATLASTGTRARFLHPTEALHGDLGCLSSGDVVVAFSNSGETEEVVRLIPSLQQLRIPLIAVSRDRDNSLSRQADVVVAFGSHREAGLLGLAPSCTTTAMLAVGDAMALVLSQLRGFTAQDFAVFHPAGNLGRELTPVRNVMRTGEQLRLASESATVRQIMIGQSRPGRRSGAVLLTAASGVLSGLFTDSDLARLLENRRDEQLDQPIAQVMTRNPITLGPDALLPTAVELMSERKVSEVPVIDDHRRPVGILDITDVLQRVSQTQQQQILGRLRIVDAPSEAA